METEQARKTIHWSSGVTNLDETKISRYRARIVNAEYNPNGHFLGVNVSRTGNINQGFVFYTIPEVSDENPQDESVIPDPIKALYDEFDVRDYRGLVGRAVNGVYSGDRLVGIERR